MENFRVFAQNFGVFAQQYNIEAHGHVVALTSDLSTRVTTGRCSCGWHHQCLGGAECLDAWRAHVDEVDR